MTSFAAVLLDAGGVLLLPDPTVLGPLLAYHGADASLGTHRRAHYAAMAVKSHAGAVETDWVEYDLAYVRAVGVAPDEELTAAHLLGRVRTAALWRWPIPEALDALRKLSAADVPMGVVSNASGQCEEVLARSGVCQVGDGPNVAMRCIVDSRVVAVAKPDPRIFDFALPSFAGIERSTIAYVGDSIAMDVAGARAAGLTPILLDPYDDHAGLDVLRITTLAEVEAMV